MRTLRTGCLWVLVVGLMSLLTGVQAASLVWRATPPANWDTTSPTNWSVGYTSVFTNYTEGDSVTFDSENYPSSCGAIMIQAGGVHPASVTVTGQRAPVGWTFSGGDIMGSCAVTQNWGNRDMTFIGGDANWNYNFTGGTTLTNSTGMMLKYQPGVGGGVDTHWFGTTNITLCSPNSGFRFVTVDSGDHLSNNFVYNGGRWLAPENGGILDGTIALPGSMYFDGTSKGTSTVTSVTNTFILTTHAAAFRHMSAIVGNGFSIDGPITSGAGGPYDLTLQEAGDNYAWYVFLGDRGGTNPPMDVRNLTLTTATVNQGTIQINADERTYFTKMRDNGGTMVLASATSVRFARSNTIELNFPMEVQPANKGFQLDDTLNVNSNGVLKARGNFGRSTGIYSTDYSNPMTINVKTGGIMEVSSGVFCPGPVNVLTGGVLRGSGTLLNNLMVTNGATLIPGLAGTIGTLSVSNLTLYPTAQLNFDVATILGQKTNDVIQVSSNLVLDGVLNIAASGRLLDGAYRIMTYSGTLTDNGLVVGTVPDGYRFRVVAGGGVVDAICTIMSPGLLIQLR